MLIDLPLSQNEATHDLFNLNLLPDRSLRLGQDDNCDYCDAEITWEWTGSPCQYGRHAVSYHYRVVRDGFVLQVLAISADENQATADVRAVAISSGEDACSALTDWLARAVTGRRPPREPLDALGLC